MHADLVPLRAAAAPQTGSDGETGRTTGRGEAVRGRVVVIDSDRRSASATAAWLCAQGWHASAAGTIDEARGLVGRGRFDAWIVVGAAAHPFYRWVAAELGEAGAPRWNFHKYLVAPDGTLAGAWPSRVKPDAREIVSAVEGLLAKS